MGYVTLYCLRSKLWDGSLEPEGVWLDADFIEASSRGIGDESALAVTLHEEDLEAGMFVIALQTQDGRLTPFTWKAPSGVDYRVRIEGGTSYGGTLQQFAYNCAQQAAFRQVHKWPTKPHLHRPLIEAERGPVKTPADFSEAEKRIRAESRAARATARAAAETNKPSVRDAADVAHENRLEEWDRVIDASRANS